MKKFLSTIFIFVILVLFIFALLELWMLRVPNEFSYKRTVLEKGDGIEILVLGASHGAKCIDPNSMGDSAFNAAIDARAYYYDCMIVEKYVPHMKDLKYVILPVAPFQQYRSFQYNANPHDGLSQMESTQRCMHLKYMGIHYGKYDWLYWSEFLNSQFDTFRRLYRVDKVRCDEKGFEGLSNSDRGIEWEKEKTFSAIDYSHKYIPLAYDENLRNMKRMVEICRNYHVIPVFVSVPCWKTAYENVPQQDFDSLYVFINRLKKVNPDVVYLNYMSDNRFSSYDFHDASHLNAEGARKFSEILYADINKDK